MGTKFLSCTICVLLQCFFMLPPSCENLYLRGCVQVSWTCLLLSWLLSLSPRIYNPKFIEYTLFPSAKSPNMVQILKHFLFWFCFSWQIKEWAILVINAQIWKLSSSQSVCCCLMKVSFSSQRSVKVVALIWLTLRSQFLVFKPIHHFILRFFAIIEPD